MKTSRVVLLASMLLTASAAAQTFPAPDWAFLMNPPGLKPTPDDGTVRRVPDSTAGYTLTQTRDRFAAPVWHPEDHPAPPEVVATGRKPGVFACAFCHRADGPGGPENAQLAGLPHGYLVQQMRDYRSGARKTSVSGRNVDLMIELAKDISDAEIDAAAAYFSARKPRRNVKVVESDVVPKTFVMSNHFAKANGDDKEPIGKRIVEMPEELERFVSRDSRVRFVAYVPPGSIKAGRELAASGGGGKTQACTTCHGVDLKGVGNVPGIAGRFASYLARQLYDFKSGARNGPESAQMKAVVEKLTADDILVLSAYAASLAP